jgi:hypothetical protein
LHNSTSNPLLIGCTDKEISQHEISDGRNMGIPGIMERMKQQPNFPYAAKIYALEQLQEKELSTPINSVQLFYEMDIRQGSGIIDGNEEGGA